MSAASARHASASSAGVTNGAGVTQESGHVEFVYDHMKVASTYVRGWFAIDLVASLPYDLLDVRDAKVLRTLRMLKAVKVSDSE